MRRIEKQLIEVWTKAKNEGKRYFPHEYIYQLIRNGSLEQYHDIDPKHSWLIAAAEKTYRLLFLVGKILLRETCLLLTV